MDELIGPGRTALIKMFFFPNSLDRDNTSPFKADFEIEYESLLFLDISCQIELITHNFEFLIMSFFFSKNFKLLKINETFA